MSLNELALFAGAGGGVLGSRLLGHRIVCYVERDPYCVKVLKQRIADGFIDDAPIWDDVRTFDGKPWRGVVDCVSGGFPCQDISSAGTCAGIDGERSGLWMEFARIIGEVRPRFAFVENSPMLIVRGLDRVLGDLAAMGFDAQWGCISAAHEGAPHIRDRAWTLADADGVRELQPQRRFKDVWRRTGNCDWWRAEPDVARVVYGLAHRLDRTRALANGQVPAVVRRAWELLSG